MHYEGPIYRPPSEADSLLVQATVGCPHNKCTFCMVYKKGPRFKVRPLAEIIADLEEAAGQMAPRVKTLFLPAGNSLAMPTDQLAAVCRRARELFPNLLRITVYASMSSILFQGRQGMARLKEAGLSRLHVGLESGHAATLKKVKKGVTPEEQIQAGRLALEYGFDLCLYVLLGLAGPELSQEHALATAKVINRINQQGELTVRLRTLVPKINTLLLHQLNRGDFTLCTPHEILAETLSLISNLNGPLDLFSDHYTNYVNIQGKIPQDAKAMQQALEAALELPRSRFRQDFVGTQ